MAGTSRDSLEGRTALRAGTKWAGAVIDARLREMGAHVLVAARSLPDDFEDVARFVAADTSTVSGVQSVAERVVAAGGVDIIVHTVGGSLARGGGFAGLADQDRALVPAMLERPRGHGAGARPAQLRRACPGCSI